jgi:hypothetical protein
MGAGTAAHRAAAVKEQFVRGAHSPGFLDFTCRAVKTFQHESERLILEFELCYDLGQPLRVSWPRGGGAWFGSPTPPPSCTSEELSPR